MSGDTDEMTFFEAEHPVLTRINHMIEPYSSDIDREIYLVAKEIGQKEYRYCNDIAEATGLSINHVELIQTLLCSADWCTYGTSPRACFPNNETEFPKLLNQMKSYIAGRWGIDADTGEKIAVE